jgi:hypothetical protein
VFSFERATSKMENEPTGGLGKVHRGVGVPPARHGVKINAGTMSTPRMSKGVPECHAAMDEDEKRTHRENSDLRSRIRAARQSTIQNPQSKIQLTLSTPSSRSPG